MTLSELANLGETLGGLAVLVSIVYLILEVRRNTKTARSTSAWNSAVALGELCEGASHNPQLSELIVWAVDEGARPEDLAPEEFSQYFLFCRGVFFKYEAQWTLWKEGTLSDEMCRTGVGGRRRSSCTPCLAAFGRSRRNNTSILRVSLN